MIRPFLKSGKTLYEMLKLIFYLPLLILYKFFIAVLSVFLTISCIFILPPVFTWRFFVISCAKIIRPDLGSILSGMDLIYGRDFKNFHTNPSSVIVMSSVLRKGSDPFEKSQKFFKWVVEDPNYKRFRQYIVPFMGYAFWKEDKEFDLKQHVKYYDGYSPNSPPVDEKWVIQLKKKLVKKPFGKNKSPWELIVIPKYKKPNSSPNEDYCIVLSRVHHSLGDGVSFDQLTHKMCENPTIIKTPVKTANKAKIGFLQMVKQVFVTIKIPYNIVRISIEVNDRDKTPWCTSPSKFTGVNNYAKSKPFPIEQIKAVRRRHGVSFVPVVLWGLSSIMRNAMIAKKVKIPDMIYCNMPFPLPNHPKKLCNHMAIVVFPLPVGIADSFERLYQIDVEYEKLKNSSDPLSVLLFLKIMSCFPYWFAKQNQQFVTMLSTIFPASESYSDMFGLPIEDQGFTITVPVPLLNSGILIGCLSARGVLTFESNFDSSILETDEEIDQIHQLMYKEFEKLKL